MLALRVVSAVVLGPLVFLVVAVGDITAFLILVAAGSSIAVWEFNSLLRRAGHSPLWPFGLALSMAFLLDPYLLPGRIAPAALALSLALSLGYLVARRQVCRSFVDWAVTWAPPLYVGFLLAFVVSLRLLPSGDRWIYLMLGITWCTDVGAYFVGSMLGRRSFFSEISPRKTVEGAVGGLIAGTGCGAVLALLFGGDVARLLIFAVVASLAGQTGDLAESLIKRQLRTKDASNLIPGHGGLLDRIDSLLFAGVVTYYWALLVGGLP